MKLNIFNMKLNTVSIKSDNEKNGGWAAIAAFLFLLSFLLLGLNINSNFVRFFDEMVYQFIIFNINDFWTKYMTNISFIGSWVSIVGIIFVLLILVWRKSIRSDIWFKIAITTGASAILNEILKLVFNRVRPDVIHLTQAHGLGFPSGHSMNGMVFFGMIALVIISELKTNWKYFHAILLGLLILNIGVSRIYLGVHYPSDVVGGFLFGAFILSVAWRTKWKRNIF